MSDETVAYCPDCGCEVTKDEIVVAGFSDTTGTHDGCGAELWLSTDAIVDMLGTVGGGGGFP